MYQMQKAIIIFLPYYIMETARERERNKDVFYLFSILKDTFELQLYPEASSKTSYSFTNYYTGESYQKYSVITDKSRDALKKEVLYEPEEFAKMVSLSEKTFSCAEIFTNIESIPIYLNTNLYANQMAGCAEKLARYFDFPITWFKDKGGRQILLEYCRNADSEEYIFEGFDEFDPFNRPF